MSPPRSALMKLKNPLPGGDGLKRGIQTHRRAAIVQCDRCDAIATGTVVGQRLTSAQLPIVYGYRSMTHAGCGGAVRAYDTSEVGACLARLPPLRPVHVAVPGRPVAAGPGGRGDRCDRGGAAMSPPPANPAHARYLDGLARAAEPRLRYLGTYNPPPLPVYDDITPGCLRQFLASFALTLVLVAVILAGCWWVS